MSYDDGKQLSNLQRIHELEEMVSELEEKNARLREELRWRDAEVLYLHRRCRILDKVLENLGVDYAAEVDKVLKAYPQLTQRGPLLGGE